MLAAVVVALLAAGCGSASGGGSASEELVPTTARPAARADIRPSTFDRWADEVRALCDRYSSQGLAVTLAFGEIITEQDVIDYIDALAPVESAYVAELLEVEPPIERRREVDRIRELAQNQLRAITRYRDAITDLDVGRLGTAAQDIYRQSWELYRRMAQLGLDDCGYSEDVVVES